MPAVAEVEFKAVNSQQMVTAFKSVGTAAQDSTTKINQNSSAVKTLGQGMKNSMGGITQAATAFATLSLSVVNTWRAYRDLGDAQIAVDRANLKVAKTTEAVRKQEALIAKIKKENTRGSEEGAVAARKIQLAEAKLHKDRKTNKMTDLEVAVRQDEINEMRHKAGTDSTAKLTDAEIKLTLLREQLGVSTQLAGEAQEQYNDTQQDFYLSLLPTALSSLAGLTTIIKGVTGAMGSVRGAGLLGAFGPLGLILTGASLAVLAFQRNFLGLRDAIGGVIDFFKSRFDLWKDTLERVFAFIQKGNWGGAFAAIKNAAVAFWNDLVRTVPFFGGINKVVDAIRKGKWDTAFNMIRVAALKFWEDLKEAIPFFAGAETFFRQLFGGEWAGAWKTLTTGAAEAWALLVKTFPILGDIATFLRTKWELASTTAKSVFNAMANELTKTGGAFDRIQQGLATLGSGDVMGGLGKISEGVNLAIEQVKNAINGWVMANFGVDLSIVESQAKDLGMKIMGWIGNALTAFSREFIDPFVASLFDAGAWIAAITASADAILAIGKGIITFLIGAVTTAVKDPKTTGKGFTDIGTGIWKGIVDWMTANMPDTKKAIQKFVGAIGKTFASIPESFKKLAQEFWAQVMKAIAALNPFPKGSVAGGAAGMTGIPQRGNDWLTGKAKGFHGTVRGPTPMIVGEKGAERVDITPLTGPNSNTLMNKRRGGGSAGGSTNITISFLPAEFAQFLRYSINDNQGVMK